MASRAVLSVLLFASASTRLAEASAFLEPSHDDAQLIAKADVEQALLSELHGVATRAELRAFEQELRPMFTALPKNAAEKLEASAVRYALHRYFVQKHGWYMRGLEPGSAQLNASEAEEITKDKAAAYVQSLLDQRMGGEGLSLHDLGVFAATLTDLVHAEAVEALHKSFDTLRFPIGRSVDRRDSDLAMTVYVMAQLVGIDVSELASEDEVTVMEEEFSDIYPNWFATKMWVQDLRLSHDFAQQARRNPFVRHEETFDDVATFVQHFGHKYGAFQDLECHELKEKLLDLEHRGTGRVRLSRFYSGNEQDWAFSESVDYLRALGALDETDPQRPSVVIPNYITSRTNCQKTSGFYLVCCVDECEGLLRQLELTVAAPSATPRQILEVIAALPSATVDAPRNLSAPLMSRLDEVAQLHGGQVPLYGRLFSQWMHHAYPRECPFPHLKSESADGSHLLSPEEWMDAMGEDSVQISEEEARRHLEMEGGSVAEEDASADVLPWTAVEESLVGNVLGVAVPARSSSYLRVVGALAAVALALAPLLRASKATGSSMFDGKSEKHMV